jgi:hypothetical protein
MIPKPAGYRGGDDAAAEFVGVTLGGHRAYFKYDDSDDPPWEQDQECRRNAVTNDWQEETC